MRGTFTQHRFSLLPSAVNETSGGSAEQILREKGNRRTLTTCFKKPSYVAQFSLQALTPASKTLIEVQETFTQWGSSQDLVLREHQLRTVVKEVYSETSRLRVSQQQPSEASP